VIRVAGGHNLRLARLRMKKRSKYGNTPATFDGERFASKKEGERYLVLKDMAKRGEIEELELQPRFAIEIQGRKICTYVADFQYRLGGERVVEDVKGMRTPVYKLKKKMVEALYPFEVTEI
jgi:hypothetical protein